MSVQSDLVVADLADAGAVAESDTPTVQWDGFSFNGLDNVKLSTLLSLLRTGDPMQDFDFCLDLVRVVGPTDAEGPVVFAVERDQVAKLALVSPMEGDTFAKLADAWGRTEDFEGWSPSEVADLLRAIGDLAESASFEGKCLLLRLSL